MIVNLTRESYRVLGLRMPKTIQAKESLKEREPDVEGSMHDCLAQVARWMLDFKPAVPESSKVGSPPYEFRVDPAGQSRVQFPLSD